MNNKIILIALVVVVLLLGGAVAFLLLKGDPEPAEMDPAAAEMAAEPAVPAKGPAMYQPMPPAFVVNFENPTGGAKFMQIKLEVMARDAGVLDKVTSHDPKIRNNLILLFSTVKFDDVNNLEGKEMLRQQALEVINKVLEDETGAGGIEEVLFTKLVMQ